jgi:hypothetical protein
MRGFLKMSALSAVLSFALVTAYNQAWSSQPSPAQGKLYQDRLPAAGPASSEEPRTAAVPTAPSVSAGRKGDRLSHIGPCADQTWPYIPPACQSAASDETSPKAVRVITIESREGANTSVLVRVPQADVASR